MPDSDGVFRDDVPVADAVEQQQPTADSPSDWQEQRETVSIDPEFDGPEQ
jgi:hypothetical protein